MPLVSSTELLQQAAAAGKGIGAFNVIQIEHAEAFARAAEQTGAPIVMQISQNAAKYHGGLRPIAEATLAIARACSAPMIVHLDHAEDRALVTEALGLGFTSVMFDGSHLEYDENVKQTAEVVAEAAKISGGVVHVEAELGKVGGKDGVHAPGVRTDPAEAAAFVAATGVQSLAVAVGSSHAMVERSASLDFELISALRAAVPVPLVLHGSSGVADADITTAVRSGMTKINISTHLNNTMTHAVRDYLAANPKVVDPRKYLGAGREALVTEVVRLLGVLNAL